VSWAKNQALPPPLFVTVDVSPRSRYSAVVAGAAAASAIAGAAAVPPCALPAAGRFRATLLRPTAFCGATAGFEFLAVLVRATRSRPGLAASVAFSGAPDFPAALAFLSAALRLLVPAVIRARPSGLRRSFFLAAFAGAGAAAGAALAFRAAAQRSLCAAAMRQRAAAAGNDPLSARRQRFAGSDRDGPFEALRPGEAGRRPGTGPQQSRLRTAEQGAARRPPRPPRCVPGGRGRFRCSEIRSGAWSAVTLPTPMAAGRPDCTGRECR
jgi:hypothetical protein